MNNTRATHNMIAVGLGTQETAINTVQTLDATLLCGTGDYIQRKPRREDNASEANGKEEADVIYDLGSTAELSLNFEKLQPHHALLMLGYGLGNVVTTAAGTGYLHTITPIDGDVDEFRSNPTFPAAQRLAKTIAKRRFYSMAVDTATITFAADAWVKGVCGLKGTGKYDSTITEETVSALNNATSLTLAANAVQGATADERLANVQIVRASASGDQYKFATVTAVSAATPAVITIESLGGDGLSSIDYKILYVPTEPAWATFPARITETPMRVSQACLYVGGGWNGTAFVGGKAVGGVLQTCEYSLNNGMQAKFTMCAGGVYAGKVTRGNRVQTIKLSREMRDWLLQNYIEQNETFGVHLLCEGAEFDTGHKYTLELIFPLVGILDSPLSTDNGVIAEAGDLKVLQHATYGSVIARIKNLVATCAA